MLNVTPLGWAATIAAILGLLVLDWLVHGRRPHAVSFREAVAWSIAYIAIALLFGVVFGVLAGWDMSAQYYAGYLVEKSLSMDNLLVFVMIIGAFAVPADQQAKAVSVGIGLALVLRAIFIALGAQLISSFSFMFLIFGVMLVLTAVQLFRHRDEDPSVEDNALVAVVRRALPLSEHYDGGRLVTRIRGRLAFTPLLVVLIAIGSSDLMFAFDSIPAVFGVTRHGYIVFAANAFALLGLRALFFLVSGLLNRLVYLSTGLSLILALIGLKLMLEFAHEQHHSIPVVSTGVSLAVVALILVVTTVASLRRVRRDPTLRAHAGALREHRRPGPGDPLAGGGEDLPVGVESVAGRKRVPGGQPEGPLTTSG